MLHASCVDLGGAGLLILGSAGSGKSALALQLIAFGAALVSDDRVVVSCEAEHLVARAPATIKGLVEARGVGILMAPTVASTRLALAVNMDTREQDRLPRMHWYELHDQKLQCLFAVDAPHFPAAVFQVLKGGRQSPT